MEAHPALHPSADALRAFTLGKLNDATAAVVMSHLDSCPDCCKQVAALSGDDFLNRLRQVQSLSGTPAPAKPLDEVAQAAKPSASQTPIPNLPPELAANQQYDILRELGRGGMGVVYLAKNKLMDRLEVLKVINKALLDRPGAVERFIREIRSAAKLNHVNVVAAHSAVQQGQLLAFAMEYVEGADLASVVKSQGPLPVAHACFYMQQAALGLQHAFEKHMVHRDIKPQNLMLFREGKKHIVKVLDFGLAKATSEKSDDLGLTGEGRMLGTPDYIAPEQSLDAARADIRADIYSLGCTLYYLLAGRPPFSARSLSEILLAHQMQEAKPLNLLRPEVPEELAAVVRKMLAKNPAKRYQTPLEVVQALAPFVKQGASAKSSPELSMGTAKPIKAEAAPLPIAPVKQPPMPQAPPAVPWESLTEGSVASAQLRQSGVIRQRRSPGRKPSSRRKWLIGGGIGVGLLLLALLGMWASGVFKVKTKDGILIVEVNEPNPDVYVDGEKMTVSWDNGGKKAKIRVKPGTRKVEVTKDGFSVDGKELTVKDGDREIFTARLVPEQRVANAGAPTPENVPPKPEPPKSEPPKSEPPKPEPPKPVVSDAPPEAGFVPLFNGKDLTGWTARDGHPARWVVRDGFVEVAPGKGDIMTQKKFGPDFKLQVEFWLPLMSKAKGQGRANSGVFLQGRYELQILDSFMNETYANSSVGALYGIIEPNKAAQEKAILPPEQWNSYDITFHAPRIDNADKVPERGQLTVVLNGVTLIDDGKFDKATGGALADRLDTPGPIRLQDHGCKVRFRTIKIKELPAAKSKAPPAAKPEAPPVPRAPEEKVFVPLFNGKDLNGWKTHPTQRGNWRVVKGVLISSGPAVSHLYSSRGDYKNFHLHVEARINAGGNSGVHFRTGFGPAFPSNNPKFPCGYEAQVYYSKPGDAAQTGSLFAGVGGPVVSIRESPGAAAEWITQEVIAEGNHLVIKVNGKTTADYTDAKRRFTSGHVALEMHDPKTVVEFRKIEIKELK